MFDPHLPIVPSEPALEDMHTAFLHASQSGKAAACLAVAFDDWARLADEESRERRMSALADVIRTQPAQPHSVIARGVDRMWWITSGIEGKEAASLARALVQAARREGICISVGVAVTRPGARFETWLKVAEEGLGVARGAGGNRAVHTELYEFLERQLAGASLPISLRAPALEPVRELPREEWIEEAPPSLRDSELTPTPRPVDGKIVELPPAEPARELAERRVSDTWRLELLERRLAKLARAFEDVEVRIARLESRANGAELGIASIYREAQGLDPDATQRELKRNLMRLIFEANLALRARSPS